MPPATHGPQGILATSVSGTPGDSRWEDLVRLPLVLVCLVGIPATCWGMVWPPGIYIGPSMIVTVVIFVLYNPRVPGPWRFFDVSVPVQFELSVETLKVSQWDLIGHRQTEQCWNATDIEAIGVFSGTEELKTCPSRCIPGRLWRARASVEEQPAAPPVQVTQRSRQAAEDLPPWFSPLQLLCGARGKFTYFFLGAQLRGAADVLPISRRMWSRKGLQELFDASDRVRLFQAGELLAAENSGRNKKRPAKVAVASLPRRRYCSIRKEAEDGIAEEAPQMDDCMICLETFQDGDHVNLLPCGHIFHCGCARRWLQLSTRCPMCKQKVSTGTLAMPPEEVRPYCAACAELRPATPPGLTPTPSQTAI